MANIELERIASVATVLGGKKALGGQIADVEGMRRAVRRGLPYRSLEALAEALSLESEEEMASVAGLAPRTLARRKTSRTLRPGESDRVYRVARVTARAVEVLGGREKAERWLKKSNAALGGEVPLRALDTDLGARQVEAVLGRIEHGVLD